MNPYLDFIKLQSFVYSDSNLSEPFVSYNSSNPLEEFDRTQRIAERNKGIVMPLLNESYVEIVAVVPHDFNSDRPLVEAQKWAEKYLVNTYIAHQGTLNQFVYQISKKAIHKYLQPSATDKSENLSVHLSVLKVLPIIINASIEVEIHADYTKENNIRHNNNYVNKNVLIHRFYGAVRFMDKLYRVKTTIKEYKQPEMFINKPYTFEVIKIVLLDESNSTILGTKVADSTKSGQLSAAKLLQNIENHTIKENFC